MIHTHMHTLIYVFYFLASLYYINTTGLAKRPSFGIYSCSGTESSLLNCPYTTQSLFTDDLQCGRRNVVGIKCPSSSGQL